MSIRDPGGLAGRLRRLLLPAAADDGPVAAAPVVPLREIFRRFWPYARPYRYWLWASLFMVALGPVLDVATIWIFKVVVDEVFVPRDLGALPLIALAYLGLVLVSGLVDFLDDYLSGLVGQRFLLGLRTDFFRHLHGLSLDFFERRKLGDVLSRLTGDAAAIETLMLSGVADALSHVLRILFFVGALFVLQWQMALVSLLVVPLFYVTARHFSRKIKEASRERRRRSGSIGAVAEESLSNMPLVQAYNRQETEIERFHEQNLGSLAATMAATRLQSAFTPLVSVIELGGALVVMTMGTWALSQGQLSLGGLLAFMALLSKLYTPIRRLSKLVNTFYSASAGAERIIEFMDQMPSVTEPEHPRPLARAWGQVRFEDVSFTYPGSPRPALEHLSLTVEPGETLALVGATGAGKSTAAKLLLRLYDPTAGGISLDGNDLRELSLSALRDNVALLLQETLVFDGTIRDNIAYGRPGATDAEIERAARAADAHEFITSLPEGYGSRVGQKGRRLSGGQRQRVAIARAMIRDAPVLVLDEPTTGLDAETGERILEPMRRLMEGRATIVISHNLVTIREATEIVLLEHGRVAERGTHEHLLERKGSYARLYRLHDLAEARAAPAPQARRESLTA